MIGAHTLFVRHAKVDKALNTATDLAPRMVRFRTGSSVLCPALSVVLCVLTLPPYDWWPFAFVQWVPLIWWAARTTPAQAGLGGALSGVALGGYLYFGAAVLDTTLFAVATVVLGIVLSMFCAILPIALRYAGAFAPYALGAVWASLELALSAIGLPFSLALTLTAAPGLLQSAALGGSTVVVVLMVALQTAWVRCALPAVRIAHVRIALSTVAVGIALTLLGNAHRPPPSEVLRVAAAQTDLHPFVYVHAEADGHLIELQQQRERLRRAVAATSTQLIVWPEIAFARFDLRGPGVGSRLEGVAELVAGNDLDARGRQFNAVLGIDQNGRPRSRHTKSRLLPRLEAHYDSQNAPSPHRALPGKPGSLICYESAFAGPARALALGGAGLLTIATSDAYAGPALLSDLHGRFAVLRAVENRRAVVRAANGGPSMIVNERGRRIASSEWFTTTIATATVNVIETPSLYARHATLIHLAVVTVGLLTILWVLFGAPATSWPIARSSLSPAAALVLLCTGGLLALQIMHAKNVFDAAHGSSGSSRPSMGFIHSLDTQLDYATLSAATRTDDLAATVAAAVRRFGVRQDANEIATRLADLESRSVFRIDAPTLLEAFGLATTPWNDTLDRSIIPCVAELNDASVVLITKTNETAIEIFSPAEGAYSTVPRSWLIRSLRESPTCIIGRTFAWDLRQ